MPDILEKRRIYWTQTSKGAPAGGIITKIELLRDVFADGKQIPQESYEVVSSSTVGHIGECECDVWTVVGSYLNYRLTLSNGNSYAPVPVEPGDDIPLDELVNLSEAAETPPLSLELSAAIHTIADQSVVVHEAKSDPHTQYLNNARGDARYSPLGHTHTPAQIGLGNVNNTSDANKPVSTAQAAADTAARDAAIAAIRNGVPTRGNDLAKLLALIDAINTLIGGTTPDGDSVTNTVAEVLAVMATYPEGVNLLTTLSGKANASDVLNALYTKAEVASSEENKIPIFTAAGELAFSQIEANDTDSAAKIGYDVVTLGSTNYATYLVVDNVNHIVTIYASNATIVMDAEGRTINLNASNGVFVNGVDVSGFDARISALESV